MRAEESRKSPGESPWLEEIAFFNDAEPHGAALNMAIDEALLAAATMPVLRVYRWARPAVSFGYFERWEPIRAAYPGREPVRRWTGGGIVLHGEDLTYSLVVPQNILGGVSASDSYSVIHRALRAALRDAGIRATTAAGTCAKVSQACFENPVMHDVLVNGGKVAGAAQRRTRAGLLHQGSVQGLGLTLEFGELLAARLAKNILDQSFDITDVATKLIAEKYGNERWLKMRM